jgi:protein translocase SecG subunit
MQHVIIAIHLMVVTALVALVLYQKSEGGALGMGSSGFMTGRGQANALTRATAILGTIFFLTSIALTVLPAWQRRAAGGGDWTKAIEQKIELKEVPAPSQTPAAPETPPAPSEGQDSIFEQLQRAQEQRQKAVTPPAAPQAPTAPKVEAPKVEAPVPEAPKSEAPVPEAPKAEPPKSEAPGVEPPKSEVPKSEVPKTEAPAAEPPKSEAPAQTPEPAAPAPATPAPQEAAPAAPEEKPAASPPPIIWKSPSQ